MAEQDRALLDEVLVGATAMATLAQDEEVFRAAVDAFRAYDGESMARLLERHQLAAALRDHLPLAAQQGGGDPLPRARRPAAAARGAPPDPREFAQLVAKLTADDAVVRLMVDAVQDRDVSAWSDADRQARPAALQPPAVSLGVHGPLPARVRRGLPPIAGPAAASRARAAGRGRGARQPGRRRGGVRGGRRRPCWRAAARRSRARSSGGGFAPFCFFLCEWFCSWRCMLVCLRLCRIYPLEKLESPIGEMREFALAAAAGEGPLERLTRGDAARGRRSDPVAGEGAALRALLHPVLPLGLLPALPAVLHLRLPAAHDRRVHQDRRALLRHRRRQPQPAATG